MNEAIKTSKAPKAVGPYSQAIKAGEYLLTSGQIPLDPETGVFVAGGIKAQTKQVMENLKQVLLAAGLDFGDVVKTTIFIVNMDDFAAVNEVYATYFTNTLPVRSCIGVASLPKGALVEIEVIAWRQK
ncbi:Endoribonuclease L-PSP/chorismate mutase-like [Acididesulfobacillus acetoxydans]|uniref:Endoribonuclease L-PSP/chorismate mutase-like n=1 Tax=Acididesulfobacillus acetoxydans TaxID=1561005 RepID=A0A8S0W1M1_9FIRM|nr:Endoribonuclease L-PSP/chorismate mutase-like [Acididesulfobacillus acetoxydans]CEJ07733.1 RutC protein PH0854 [Acididesulfobacillus acetoxydans]